MCPNPSLIHRDSGVLRLINTIHALISYVTFAESTYPLVWRPKFRRLLPRGTSGMAHRAQRIQLELLRMVPSILRANIAPTQSFRR
jgi:hypothetical protein